MIEFKGPDDSLTEFKYITNEIRTNLLILDDKVKVASFHNTLNMIVCAHYPERFFAFMEEAGYKFEPDPNHRWLYRRKVGLQNVAIVVLNQMPLEQMYYEWLRLAPTDSTVWKELAKIAILTDDRQLLSDLQELNFEVVRMTAKELKQVISEMSPQQHALWLARQIGGAKLVVQDIKNSPEDLKKVIGDVKPEILAQTLDADEEEKMFQILLKRRQERERQQAAEAQTEPTPDQN